MKKKKMKKVKKKLKDDKSKSIIFNVYVVVSNFIFIIHKMLKVLLILIYDLYIQ